MVVMKMGLIELRMKEILREKRYTHKPVNLLMRSRASCCGGGLIGTCLLIIPLYFYF